MEFRPLTRTSIPPSAQPYTPNAILRWLYARFFRHIHVDERWSGVVREAANRGVVVYVMRSISVLDFLCLDYLVKRFGLPLVRFVNDLGLWILEPFGRGGRRIRFRRQIPEDKALRSVVAEQFSALLFLRRPPRLGRIGRKGEELEVDLLRTLVEVQRTTETPILLVPQTFVWSKLPPRSKRGLLDLFFGPAEWPGKIRVFVQFVLNYRNVLLRSGDPFDLAKFLEDHPHLDDAEAADKIRYALLRRMERERTLVLGPNKKSPARIQEELLRSPRVRSRIEAEARASKKRPAKIEAQARKELSKLCANQTPWALSIAFRFLDWVWNRIYDGLVVDTEGVDRVRDAARNGAVVLLPSHKSHVDYLVLSCVLYGHALSPPLIAAGENLSFWPLGPILRRCGAFFIRRSFQGKKLYSALVDAYIRKLLVEGFPMEFFIEGGRSRTGKLLSPKYGLLSMVIDAALMLRGRKIHFVPISIGYERIVEENSYLHELAGGEKQSENIGGLLRTPRVLRAKYGRLYVQFGEILDFDQVLRDVLGPEKADGESFSPVARRNLIRRLAHRVTYEIDRVTVVTPAALVASALLVHRRRGMTHTELVATCTRLLHGLERLGARIAPQVRSETGELRADTVEETVKLFLDGRLIVRHATDDEAIYRIPSERRIALEYYKNNILHFFVPSALISSAMLASTEESVSIVDLRERVQQLSRLFKYEFMYRADAPFEDIFADALGTMLEAGEVERVGENVRTVDGERGAMVELYASMVRTYFESYLLALRGSVQHGDDPLSPKEWVKRTMALGQRLYLAGAIELRESLSKPKLENALQALRDHELIASKDGNIAGPKEPPPRERHRELEKQLLAFLR